MNKKSSHRVFATLLLTLFVCFPLYLISKPFGVQIELRRTGGAFPGESLCSNSGCHQDSPADSGPGGLSVTANGTPIHEYEYTPGEFVSLMVKISDPSAARWGFQMTARTDDGCLQAGSFQAGENAVEVRSNTATIAPCPMATIDFPVHKVAKEGRDGEMTFLVNWTAPTQDIGPIKFAAAGNAANGNNLEHRRPYLHLGGHGRSCRAAAASAADGAGDPAPRCGDGQLVADDQRYLRREHHQHLWERFRA